VRNFERVLMIFCIPCCREHLVDGVLAKSLFVVSQAVEYPVLTERL